jgi:hypothetical protein
MHSYPRLYIDVSSQFQTPFALMSRKQPHLIELPLAEHDPGSSTAHPVDRPSTN